MSKNLCEDNTNKYLYRGDYGHRGSAKNSYISTEKNFEVLIHEISIFIVFIHCDTWIYIYMVKFY